MFSFLNSFSLWRAGSMNHNNDVAIDITAMLEEAESAGSNECCIYKVPLDIRRLNEDAYTPKVVSIGPFHHNTHPRLLNMQRHKRIYCKAFLQRTGANPDSWIRWIQEKEHNFRRCYSDTFDLNNKELVKMIFVDSGFIFELFWSYYFYDTGSNTDTSLLKPWLNTNIRLDLLLLENQLPFSILQDLFHLSFQSNPQCPYPNPPSFIDLTIGYFKFYNRCDLDSSHFGDNSMIRNFTDLIRFFHLQHPPTERPQRGNDGPIIHIPSATELLEAGVKFKVNEENKCLLDLKFSRGVLEIPQLKVEDWTEVLFRNMVALEQCHYPGESYITDYVAVLDFLVNTGRDVDILVQKKVLVHWLGDTDSVAILFNGLWKNVIHSNFNENYNSLCQNLNAFCRNRCRKLLSTLRRDYCKTPWQAAATFAAIILLILTVIQTVCSVWQVIQQQNASPKIW